MVATVLAPYDVITLSVSLTAEEKKNYQETRQIYLNFLRQNSLRTILMYLWRNMIGQI